MNELVRTSQELHTLRERAEKLGTALLGVLAIMLLLVVTVVELVASLLAAITSYGRIIFFGSGTVAARHRAIALIVALVLWNLIRR